MVGEKEKMTFEGKNQLRTFRLEIHSSEKNGTLTSDSAKKENGNFRY